MNHYKHTVILHEPIYTGCIKHTAVGVNAYSKTCIRHTKLYQACVANIVPTPEPPVLLEPIAGWTGYEDCVLPPDLSKALLIATLTGDYLISTTEDKNLTGA